MANSIDESTFNQIASKPEAQSCNMLRHTKLGQTFKAPNEVGLFPFTNGVYGVYKRVQRRLVLANEPRKQRLFVCKFVCAMLHVNLYVFGKTIGIHVVEVRSAV